jgi:CheY-like chemotaxis protein
MSLLTAKYPLEILIAEDNFINQKLIQKLFEVLGYKTDLVTNGMEAVRIVEEKKYDLIFMDIQMPEMDGMEASILINERLGINAPVIIAMTANAAKSDKESCLLSGISDYISKPLKLQDLSLIISHWAELIKKPISDSN